MGAATSMQGAKQRAGDDFTPPTRSKFTTGSLDLGADVDVVRARDEVTRLRRLLRHVMAMRLLL